MDADNATKLKVEYDEVYKAAEKVGALSYPSFSPYQPRHSLTFFVILLLTITLGNRS